MTYQDIQFELAGGIARLTLNRPDKLNSFTANMHGEVAHALTRVETEGARVLVLTGAGRGFCAGQDLSERKPVSYTHLDVYKRQGAALGRPVLARWTLSLDVYKRQPGCTAARTCGCFRSPTGPSWTSGSTSSASSWRCRR